jgi:prephenate dehydrogenase
MIEWTASSGFSTVAIVGVGLIGGSIAAAVKQRGIATAVMGVGRNAARLEEARRAGVIDHGETDAAAVADAELVIVCTPVDRIAADVLALASHSRRGVLFTDAGSVKGSICSALRGRLPDGAIFVGSHPLAGSEKAGFENADPDLFAGRVCVMTPENVTPMAATARVRSFWERLGMRVVEMAPARHDAILGLTSHLPHAVAAALASLLEASDAEFAATGFRDTTRIAAGDAELWSAIFSANREPLLQQMDRFQQRIAELRSAIASGDVDRVTALLGEAKRRRDALG